ncbi:MAG: CapA family protein, partial [Clostridia bacterium]|nr:CapA family protein [Clostridia bacterium]
ELPAIFTEINEEEYKLLIPLASQAFIEAEKKRKRFVKPEQFGAYTDEEFKEYLLSDEKVRTEYIKDERMDFAYMYREAAKVKDNTWQESRLEGVKEYLLKQL